MLLECLHRALAAPVGIELATNNVELLRNRLYKVRTEAQNPAFEALTFCPSRTQPLTHLWIMKNSKASNGQS